MEKSSIAAYLLEGTDRDPTGNEDHDQWVQRDCLSFQSSFVGAWFALVKAKDNE